MFVAIHPLLPILCAVSTRYIFMFSINGDKSRSVARLPFIPHTSKNVKLIWLEQFDVPTFAIIEQRELNVYELHRGAESCEFRLVYSEAHPAGLVSLLPGLFLQLEKSFILGQFLRGYDNETFFSIRNFNLVSTNASSGMTSAGDCVDEKLNAVHIFSYFDVDQLSMRFWLCSSSSKSNDMKREEFVEGHEVEFEGSNTIPICELKFSSDSLHFVPCRIRHFKCKVAILFKADYFLSDPSRFIIYDLNSRGTICTKFSVRDVSFIDENNILVLRIMKH